MKLSTANQMKNMDKQAVEHGIPDIVLMENAAIKSFNELLKHYKDIKNKKSVVFVGGGNNGGDALTISRHLYNNGSKVFIYILTSEEKLKGSPRINFDIIRNMQIPYQFVQNESDFNVGLIQNCDIIIDGIFGTGLTRAVEGNFKKAIELINSSSAFKLSIDIPSGVQADTGKVLGIAVKADLVPTFALAKPAHFLYPAREYSKETVVVDISTPRQIIEDFDADFYSIETKDIHLKKRALTSHKGSFGHLAIIGGSLGKSGAVMMSSMAALRTGAGLVSAVIPKSINCAFESNILEAMSYPVEEKNGFISKNAKENIINFVKDKDVIALGMGLGVTADTQYITEEVLKLDKPVLIDADGINCISKNLDILKTRKNATILTPHPKEFSRLTGRTTTEVLKNRVEIIKNFAIEYGVIVVLKMADTLICDTNGKIYINTTGNPALATGGSGDVLSGIIAALIAQKYTPLQAAKMGVFLHGKTADILVDKGLSYESITPSDIIKNMELSISFFKNYRQ